jgi:hypothetical protein
MEPCSVIKQFKVQTMKNKSSDRWREEGKVIARGSGGQFVQK